MPPYRSSALLASAALVVGAVLVPASAFADDTTTAPAPGTTVDISIDQLTQALTAAKAPTTAAARAGWVTRGATTLAHQPTVDTTAIYAVDRGLTDTLNVGPLVEAEHSGTYFTVAGLNAAEPGVHIHRALKAIRKPHATWVFSPDRSLDLHNYQSGSLIALQAPDTFLDVFTDTSQFTLTGTPTETIAGDGSTTTYTFAGTHVTGGSQTDTVTINAQDVLTRVTSTTAAGSGTSDYTYGTQHVDLPAKKKTVTIKQVNQGYVLSTLPKQVRTGARVVASEANDRAQGHPVKVAAIRSYARRMARSVDRSIGLKVLTTTAIAGGVRIIGTNHFTHARATYTVRLSGKRAVAHQG